MTQCFNLNLLQTQINHCDLCTDHLPYPPRPIYQVHPDAKLLIVGQAPSLTVQETGILWNDASGKRLLDWLEISSDTLYNKHLISILPMGFCYPGKNKNGDLPPSKVCAPLWHQPLINFLNVRLTLLIGNYAQYHYLKEKRKKTLTETVSAWQEYLPDFIPLPHPSPLNNIWLRRNNWFVEALPEMRKVIKVTLES